MDQRVSPWVTTCVAGSCPAGAGAGAACDVSGAGCVVSGRACVVSCATSSGAGPASSPATRASRAARSERQIVVLLIKGLRERVERFRLAPRLGRHLGGGFGPREIARALPAPPPPPPPPPPRPQKTLPRASVRWDCRLPVHITPEPVLQGPRYVHPRPPS